MFGFKCWIQGWGGARHLLAVLMLSTLFACATSTSPLAPPRLALASAYYNDGQWRVALEQVHKVLQDHPKHPTALGLEALIYAQLKEPALAAQRFVLAEQSAPSDPDIAHNHAWFLCEQGQYPAASRRFEVAVQQSLYPEKAKTYWVWGGCAQKAGDMALARQLWVQSMSQQKDPAVALSWVYSLKQQGHSEQAQQALTQFNALPAATPETIWLGAQWAWREARQDALKLHGQWLAQRFPQSTQWSAYQRGAFND